MNVFQLTAYASFIILFLNPTWISATGADNVRNYKILFSGVAGTRFKGHCTVAMSSGTKVMTLDDSVPLEHQVVGNGLSCQIQAEGRVEVDIEHEGGRTRSATNGGAINIRLR